MGLMLMSLSNIAYCQEIKSSTFPPDSILIGDQAEWSVRFNAPNDAKVKIDTFVNPLDRGIEVMKNLSIDTLKKGKKFTDFEIKAVITSFDSGAFVIPERTIYMFKEGELIDTLVLKSRTLNVNTIPIDTATYELAALKPQFRYPITAKEIGFWVLIVLAVLAVAYFIYRMVKNIRENKTILGRPIVVDPAHIVALRELERIRGEHLWQNNKQKQYYTQITDALRIYLEGRYGIQTMEKTSKEILDLLNSCSLDKNDFKTLEEFFITSDLVKFAKYQASIDENEEALVVAVRFVNNTFIKELEDSKNG